VLGIGRAKKSTYELAPPQVCIVDFAASDSTPTSSQKTLLDYSYANIIDIFSQDKRIYTKFATSNSSFIPENGQETMS